MKYSKYIISALLLTALLAIAGCSDNPAKQFKQPKETVMIVTTTSFHPSADNPLECGEPYDNNDIYPNKTDYLDKYGNHLLETWNHPDGEIFMYARSYYYYAPEGQLDRIVQWEPPKKPKTSRFVRDEDGGIKEITETILLPDRLISKTEYKHENKENPREEIAVYETRTTTSTREALDGGRVQVKYHTERNDSIREVGSKVYDQQSGNIVQHTATEYEKKPDAPREEVKREFGKEYTYTPDGKVATVVVHEGTATKYFAWNYDDHGNWISYRYHRVPSDGKSFTQDKAYTYNEDGEWTRCITVTNGVVEAIVIRTFETINK